MSDNPTARNSERWFGWGVSLLSLAIVVPVLLCTYWLVFDRAPPITVSRGELAGYQKQPDGSYVVFVRWFGERHRDCPGVSRRWLADGALVPLPDIPYPPETHGPEAGPVQWEVPVEVPGYFVTTGHLKLAYRIRIDYACNPMQEIAWPIRVSPPPVPFELQPDGTIKVPDGVDG